MTQLSFFESDLPSKIGNSNSVDYSYSKYEVFDSCERKYYYTYYGSKKTKALNEPLKVSLINLSELDNRHLVTGEIIHSVIAWFLRSLKKQEIIHYAQIENFAISRLNNVFEYTALFKSTGAKKESKFRTPLLKEILYDYNNYGELKNELEENIRNNLYNFFHSEKFEGIRNGALSDASIIEGKSNFYINDIKVSGKIDLAFEEDNSLIINDWKTGKKYFEETSLQLLIYALWARSKEVYLNKNIIIQKSYLAGDTIDVLKFSESQLLRVKAKIRQQVEILNEMDDFGNNAVSSAFPVRKQENKCKLCSFEKICYR